MLRPLIITAVISTSVGGLFYLGGAGFWIPTGIAVLSQFVIFFLINYFSDIYVRIKSEQIINDRIAEYSKQGADVACAFCGEQAFVPVDLCVDNTYESDKCHKENLITVQISTAQTTAPLKQNDQEMLKDIDIEKE